MPILLVRVAASVALNVIWHRVMMDNIDREIVKRRCRCL